ncbi:MAG: hypothetical protein M1822_004290 [Bathelium mastoideum]|nr:MAG: hypothetical protein M1822_004290 [Bathelium mastoideum]
MCKQVIRVYPLCTPNQPQPPWHQSVDETVQCQEAINRGNIQCEELDEPEFLTIKNSRCPACLLHDRQEREAHEAWERQALEESERLATEHAQLMGQRQADLAREEEEQLQRILQESEQMAQQAPAQPGLVDDEDELRKAMEASMGTAEEDRQRRATHSGVDDEEELRRAIEVSWGTTHEDEQRRAAQTGPRIFFVRHVKKMCCGKVIKEQTDIEKDAESDGIPFLEEEDYMPCDDCVRRMFAEQDALQYGGPSTGADVPLVGSSHQPSSFDTQTSPVSPQIAPQLVAEDVDLDPTGRGKAPRYAQPQAAGIIDSPAQYGYGLNQDYPPMQAQAGPVSTNPPDSELPGYMSSMNLSNQAVAPPPPVPEDTESAEITHLQDLSPEEEEEEIRKQRERRAQMNASLVAQGRSPLPDTFQASSSFSDAPTAFKYGGEPDESRPATPRTVMANQPREDAAREHLAAARANLQRLQQQRNSGPASSAFNRRSDDDDDDEEDDDTLDDLPAGMSCLHVSPATPRSGTLLHGGSCRSPQALAGSSSYSTQRRSGGAQGPSGGPEDHDWDHDWLEEEGNQSARLPSFASSIDVSRGTRPVPDQETE